MAIRFKKGDVVVLKSGGPPMSIDALPGEIAVGMGKRESEYLCRWFKGATPDSGWFGDHLLDVYVIPSAK